MILFLAPFRGGYFMAGFRYDHSLRPFDAAIDRRCLAAKKHNRHKSKSLECVGEDELSNLEFTAAKVDEQTMLHPGSSQLVAWPGFISFSFLRLLRLFPAGSSWLDFGTTI
jgi:hypothetical protein